MRAVSLTNRGGRKNNEDHIAYANADGIWCFVLCDGLGGQECGEVASEIVCNVICEEFKKEPEISSESIRGYALKAAEKLGQERDADMEKYNMSSTVVVLLTDGKKAIWLHMGDSRLYFFGEKWYNRKEMMKGEEKCGSTSYFRTWDFCQDVTAPVPFHAVRSSLTACPPHAPI